MEENQKMNVVVLGISGAGKSTLIKSISGNEIVTGIGLMFMNQVLGQLDVLTPKDLSIVF